jgi:hypothetical protein
VTRLIAILAVAAAASLALIWYVLRGMVNDTRIGLKPYEPEPEEAIAW